MNEIQWACMTISKTFNPRTRAAYQSGTGAIYRAGFNCKRLRMSTIELDLFRKGKHLPNVQFQKGLL